MNQQPPPHETARKALFQTPSSSSTSTRCPESETKPSRNSRYNERISLSFEKLTERSPIDSAYTPKSLSTTPSSTVLTTTSMLRTFPH